MIKILLLLIIILQKLFVDYPALGNESLDLDITRQFYTSGGLPVALLINSNTLLVKCRELTTITKTLPLDPAHPSYRDFWVVKSIEGSSEIPKDLIYSAVDKTYPVSELNEYIRYDLPDIILHNKIYKTKLWRREADFV